MRSRSLSVPLALLAVFALVGSAASARAEDCNSNEIDDACDIDCGAPGGPCDVSGCGQSADCNANGVPDECEPDFDADGLIDACDSDIDADGVDNANDVCVYTPLGARSMGKGEAWETSTRTAIPTWTITAGFRVGSPAIWANTPSFRMVSPVRSGLRVALWCSSPAASSRWADILA